MTKLAQRIDLKVGLTQNNNRKMMSLSISLHLSMSLLCPYLCLCPCHGPFPVPVTVPGSVHVPVRVTSVSQSELEIFFDNLRQKNLQNRPYSDIICQMVPTSPYKSEPIVVVSDTRIRGQPACHEDQKK
jgi:hypothetical protein